jgi:HEAT repeat protein
MSIKRLALSLAFLASLTGPALLSQDYGAGLPEDIAAVLPAETALFAEIIRPSKLFRDWREYVGAFCTKEGKANVVQSIEKAVKDGLVEAPEKLLKDIEQGFPAVHRLAVAMGRPKGQEEPFFATVLSASNEAFGKTLIDDLKVFAAEERPYQGSTILVIRKLGKHDLGSTLCMAAAGKRLVFSPYPASVMSVLDRASGKAPGGDLRKNGVYARLASPPGEDPALRAFADFQGLGIMDLFGGRGGGYRRAGAQQADVADAALGFRKIRGLSVEATLRPGAIAATTRVAIDSACPLYEAWRQPAGPKEALKFIPADAQVVSHLNLKGGTQVLADIQGIVRRFAEIEANASPEDKGSPRRHHRSGDDGWKQEFEREMGVSLDDVAGAISTEIAFAMVGDDALANDQNMLGSLLFVLSLTDAEKAKQVVQKVTQKLGNYETKTEGEATFFLPAQEGRGPAFALQGKTALIGMKKETLQKALKAAADGKGIAKSVAVDLSTASKTVAFRNNALWSLMRMASRGSLPEVSKDLDLGAFSAVLITEEKNEIRLTSRDAGVGLGLQAGLMMMPLGVLMFSARGFGPLGQQEGFPTPKAALEKPVPALPADNLESEVRKHLGGMRSDEVVAREDSEAALRALGPQAARLLAEAVRKETDVEVKGRILKILTDWRAYDAFPELLKTKVDGFLASFEKATAGNGGRGGGTWIQWRQNGMSEFPYGLEPMYWDTGYVRRLEHSDLLDAPQGMRALVERVTDPKLNVQAVRNLSAVLALHDCSSASDLLLAAREKIEDGEARMFLQVALGWSDDPKAKGALYAGLKDPDLWARRASFLGVEKTKDAAAIPKLMELLSDKDPETRWNASFTLRELSGGQAAVNIYLPEDELKSSLSAAREWWEKNKSTFRIGD